jgi:hypothetical protein
MNALVEEAMKKASIAWLTVEGARYPVWCLWSDDSLYVVSGPGEQPAPGLAGASAAQVTARGDHGGRIVTWPATVSQVTVGDEEWERVVPQLAGKRLNSPGGATVTAERWAAECVVSRLVPAGDPAEAGESLPDTSGAAPVGATPAARPAKRPFRLHRVRGVPFNR